MLNINLMPIQWSLLNDIDDVEPIGDGDSKCLKSIFEVLKSYGMESRFGVALLHKHFDLDPDEIMMESNDTASRTLTIEAVKAKDAGENNIGTIFSLHQDGIEVMSHCHQYCKRGVFGNHFGAHRKMK